jgi:hypothetical protein
MYEQRNFAIFSLTEIDKIDFSQVLETDSTKSFVKWDQGIYDPTPYEVIDAETGETTVVTPEPPQPPAFLSTLTTLEGPYTYSEILDILSTPEWTAPMEEMV